MEQRRVRRVPIDWKVTLHLGKQVTYGRALQFSEYGMLVTPADAAQVGQRYDVLFTLPGQRSSFRVRGIGVYTSPAGVGIRFEHVPPEITTVLRNFVSGTGSAGGEAGAGQKSG